MRKINTRRKDTMMIDMFKTTDGKVFKLIRTGGDHFEIKRNFIIFHTCETLEMATEKFYKIKELMRVEGELAL